MKKKGVISKNWKNPKGREYYIKNREKLMKYRKKRYEENIDAERLRCRAIRNIFPLNTKCIYEKKGSRKNILCVNKNKTENGHVKVICVGKKCPFFKRVIK